MVLATLVACGTDPGSDSPGTTTEMSSSEGSEVPGETEDEGESSSESTDSDGESESESGDFVSSDNTEPEPDECDIWMQDCAEGDKCVPWMATEGSGWQGFTCVPVLGEQAAGEPCTIDPSDSSDDCDADSACYNLELFDGVNAGICHTFCEGSADDPMCEGGHCIVGNGYPGPALCFDACDPLAQDCNEGQSCHWWWGWGGCTALGEGAAPGEPCQSEGFCEPASVCVGADVLPSCDEVACCTSLCSVEGGDEGCAQLPGTICVPIFGEFGPPEYTDLGQCVVPEMDP